MAMESVGQAECRPESPHEEGPQIIGGDVGLSAACEIESIARCLRARADDSTEFEFLLRGALLRVQALAVAIAQVLGGVSKQEVAEIHQLVFGAEVGGDHA